MKRVYRMRFEVMRVNPGTVREISILMEASDFGSAVRIARLYLKKHYGHTHHQRILGVDEIGELTTLDAP
jgi:hypothetical protein